MKRKRAARKKSAPARTPKKNGHGGKRAGAGRKRDRLPQAMLDELGAAPNEPKALDEWVRKVLAKLVVMQMRGEVAIDLAASIRATCGEIRRNLPSAPAPVDPNEDLDDEEDEGPELEEDASDGALRVDH